MDMVNPTMDELLKKVDSKYTLVVLAAKRARQLLDGAELKVNIKSTKNVTNALEEIIEDRIKYERTKEVVK
jgi:DNA-directed RNA polymerase subunit omega